MSQTTAPLSKAGLFFWSLKNRDWLFGLLLLAVTVIAYQPAWSGKPLWDDDGHITRPALRSWDGLARIWFEPGATQQYYPLTHSAFWLEYMAFGDATTGYHIVNILLHCCSALLLLKILRRLEIPGAYLTAAIFALHPVHVETVAWISELKNTLSGVFYFSAALVYLKFDSDRKPATYATAIALFALGLLSKTTVATLPAALLVIFWWKRGAISWRKDVVPLVPFFFMAIAAGFSTAWTERHFIIGREITAFDFTWVERFLIAGRTLWFYIGKLFRPAGLIFIYPRWHVSQSVWWQYWFPAAWLALLACAWLLRKQSRGPLAAFLFFTGTLFPALGFVNVYPFVYSFVADHFQYLASAGIITFTAACAALVLERMRGWKKNGGCTLIVCIIALLAARTWQQCGIYADAETLYWSVLKQNPDCWMAYNDLGNTLMAQGRTEDAIPLYRKALSLRPVYAKAENNLGEAFNREGRFVEAGSQFQKALAIDPNLAQAHNNLGNFLRNGHLDDAIGHYKAAIKIQPDFAAAHDNLGSALYQKGRLDEAIVEFHKALDFAPDLADAHLNLGNALVQKGRARDGIAHYEAALKARPGDTNALNNLAWVLATSCDAAVRDGAKALPLALEAERISGGKDPGVLATLAASYARTGQFSEAVETAGRALKLADLQHNTPLAKILRMQIVLYRSKTAFQESAR